MKTVALEFGVKITTLALEDAVHLALDEVEIARLVALVVRDPFGGRPLGDGGFRQDWTGIRVLYDVAHFPESSAIYVLRFKPVRKRGKSLAALGTVAKDISVRLITNRLAKLMDKDEG
jgi:hypothetical protein